MKTLNDLANLIFKEDLYTLEELEKMYPKRNLKEGAMVTRFAPSPTGFLHTGSLFASLIAYKLASQSDGVFYIRLEDTDQKREIEGSGDVVFEQLKLFGITPSEGYLGTNNEKGNYGPYVQSKRAKIYHSVIKHMINLGLAYPCFCSQDDLKEMRQNQEINKENFGYYGKYAKCRNLTIDEAYEKILNNEPYVIRFKSHGDYKNKVVINDLIRGRLELSENDQDIIIMKSDLLPTYHFAHLVDDHFMHTTNVTRGEEWLPSLPVHIELFNALGFELPKYAHLPVVMKNDNGVRRKLSKRKDFEAAVSYFIEKGYPKQGFIEYLMTIANSNYEKWREENPKSDYHEFDLTFDKMSLDGALFDLMKLNNLCKEAISRMTKDEIVNESYQYAKEYNKDLLDLINRDINYYKEILNIEREKENPRKDYANYEEIFDKIKFFYDDYYLKEEIDFLDYNIDTVKLVLNTYKDKLNLEKFEEEWFNDLKETAISINFAASPKEYKKNKELYLGSVGDFAAIIRIAISGRNQIPNPYYCLKILGLNKVLERFDYVLNRLK